MPYALGAVQVQAGQTYTVPVGSAGTVGAVVCANESPYAVNASISATGAPGQWIVAQTADLIACDVSGFNGTLTFTTDNYLSNAASAPSFLLYLTAFAPGEPIRGTYPAPLMRLANGAIGVATQLVNDGNPVGTNIIESTPAGAVNSYVLVRNDGTFQVWAISNNVLTELINLTPGASAAAASLALQLLTISGALKLDGGAITTTGNGNLTIGHSGFNSSGSLLASIFTLSTQLGGGLGEGVQISFGNGGGGYSDLLFQFIGSLAAGNYGAFQFYSVFNGSKVHNFDIGITGGVVQALSWIDNAGVLHASAPVTLAAGNQETGTAGFEFTAAAASVEGAYMPNFKTVMTRTPTSVTLTVGFSSNFKGLSADSIGVYGFRFVMQSVAAGLCQWIGIYTTVGNCLLAYDATARTFDHHCDHCGAVQRGVALSTLAVQPGPTPGRTGVSYVCPECGTSEHFNCALGAADEADTTPQGSGAYVTTRGAQATLIRQLMSALGLEVAS